MAVLKFITFLIFIFIKSVDDLFCSFLKWMGRIMINFFLYLTQLLSSVKKKKGKFPVLSYCFLAVSSIV